MVYFQCDYVEGGHPKILERMTETNMQQMTGYGLDGFCDSARARIREACGNAEADVHFLMGGTQTNLVAISSVLRPYQGVLTAAEGHIACHETGAIEATGHKVLPLPSADGTITGQQVADYCQEHYESESREHTVMPGMVYVSFPTESGTLYSKKQLTELSESCHAHGLPLYLDGARLGYGLAAPDNDLTLEDIAGLCDLFYIGGTKCGALFGEALVITNDAYKKDIRYAIKQRGAMLAKGWLLGLQFDVLFTDGLYQRICRRAVEDALRIRRAFEEAGIALYGSSKTNQQFAVLSREQLAALEGKYVYETWCRYDETHQVVRFCTSWGTTQENVEALIRDIQALGNGG